MERILRKSSVKLILTIAISLVWLINGLFCKLLNFVPRHQEIISRIIGTKHSFLATKVIGSLEILLFAWILTRIKSRWCALLQMAVITIMNIIEFIFTPELLLFGKANSIVAAMFITVIFFTEFMMGRLSDKNSFNQ